MNHAYDGWDQDLSDDDDEQLDEYRYTKSSILFCIEATPTMLAPTLNLDNSSGPPSSFPPPSATHPNSKQDAKGKGKMAEQEAARTEIRKLGWKGKSPPKSKLEVVLLSVYAMMKRKVISSPKDQVGVVVWNTAATENSQDAKLENSVTLFAPTQVTAKNLRMMKELLERCEEDENYLAERFSPNKRDSRITDAFGHCSTLLIQNSPSAQNQIFWVTDNDDPVRGIAQLFNVAMNKRKDLKDRDIAFQPFFVPPTDGEKFDLDKFYGEIVSIYSDNDESMEEEWPVVHFSLEVALFGMIQSMRLKESAKRVAFKIPFHLADGLVIGISGYNMIGEEKKKLPTKIDANTEEGTEVISEVVYKDADTAAEIQRGQIKKYFQVGHSDLKTGVQAAKIFFSEEEVRRVKAVGRLPGLRLLGFLPREGNLYFWQSVKQSYFIYPEEDRWEGSTRTFASLLKTMVKKDVIAYGSFIGRRAARPQIVVLLPQEEKLNDAGVQVLPPGIHVCQLPFSDDIRDLGIGQTPSCLQVDEDGEYTEDQPAIDAAKRIIKNATKTYKPDLYPNPALNYFYECLAAAALGEDDIPEPEDKTYPPYKTIDSRVGPHIQALRTLIPPQAFHAPQAQPSKSARAKSTVEDGPPPDLSDFLEDLQNENGGDISVLKVDQLKPVLKKIGKRTSGLKKAELVATLESYLEEHGLLGGRAKKKKVKEEDEAMEIDDGGEDGDLIEQPAKRRKKALIDDSD